MNRIKIKKEAREILHDNFWEILKPHLIVFAFSFLISYLFTTANNLNLSITFTFNVILYPLNIGIMNFILNLVRKKKDEENVIYKYYSKFIITAGLYLLISLFTSLWTFLFIIPGIIASLSYSMSPYIMIDKDLTPLESISASKKMMKGYKADYFIFKLSFIGWYLISIIAFWYVIPYISVATAIYYEELNKSLKFD